MITLLNKLIREPSSVVDSNLSQRLHHRTTVNLLIVLVVLITAEQYFGQPVTCYHNAFKVSDNQLNRYCYWLSDYQVVDEIQKNRLFSTHSAANETRPKTEHRSISYYQWVSYLFVFQALSFYSGRYLFKTFDKNRFKMFVENLNAGLDEYRAKKKEMNDTFAKKTTVSFTERYEYSKSLFDLLDKVVCRLEPLLVLKVNGKQGFVYVLSELVNLTMCLLQIYCTDRLFKGEFLELGVNFIREPTGDYLSYVFPKMTKCSLHIHGPSGTVQNSESLCVNSLNVLYEKVFVLLWFWYWVLCALTSAHLLWHALCFLLFNRCLRFVKIGLDDNYSRDARKITKDLTYVQWLFIDNVKSTVHLKSYKFFLKILSRDLDLKKGIKKEA